MQIIKDKNSTYLFPSHSFLLPKNNKEKQLLSQIFDVEYWSKQEQIVGESVGRNITYFVKSELTDTPWVLRHYYRGGLIAKLIKDRYLFSSLENTRVYKEMSLLEKMIDLDLPVPKPIGGKIQVNGLFYRADLMMEKISAQDLVALLKSAPLSEKIWKLIGTTIADFHNQGVYHSDLNAHNIMLDNMDSIQGSDNKVWLIDFDQCEIREKASSWQQDNLNRLKRSFEKEKNINKPFYYSSKEWEYLNNEYTRKLNMD